jgi:hypothetical protein
LASPEQNGRNAGAAVTALNRRRRFPIAFSSLGLPSVGTFGQGLEAGISNRGGRTDGRRPWPSQQQICAQATRSGYLVNIRQMDVIPLRGWASVSELSHSA